MIAVAAEGCREGSGSGGGSGGGELCEGVPASVAAGCLSGDSEFRGVEGGGYDQVLLVRGPEPDLLP